MFVHTHTRVWYTKSVLEHNFECVSKMKCIFIFRFVFEQRYSCTRNISQYLNVLARHMAFGGPPETAVPCHFWDCTWAQLTNCSHKQDDIGFEHVLLCVDICEPCFPEGMSRVGFSVVRDGIASQLLNSSSSCDFRQSMAIYVLSSWNALDQFSSRCFSSSKFETRLAMPGVSGPVFVPHGEHFWLAFQDPNTSQDLLELSVQIKILSI